ncbi:MAG TPA: FTR1 family protein [Longimicrobiales bacterium]|nr:FTR1 family protein [Longimicrobiales bacterium]
MRRKPQSQSAGSTGRGSATLRVLLTAAAVAVGAVMVWQAVVPGGNPDPLAGRSGSGVLDIGVLVFREGLESILVLAAVTATMVGPARLWRKPVVVGAAVGVLASLVTWKVAVGIIDRLTESLPALQVQAFTGLLAIVVLLLVMNWFFHRIYWTGWISAHTKRKKALLKDAGREDVPRFRIFFGLGLLGFTSLYREGFEVVLFLQNYRLKLGAGPVLDGVLVGSVLTALVAVLTFAAHRRLPYKKMLVLTGFLLGIVLLVMVGEQAQEMQLAHWLPTTPIPWLAGAIPGWAELWFAVFPTVETLVAQALAAAAVVASYAVVRRQVARDVRRAAVAAD